MGTGSSKIETDHNDIRIYRIIGRSQMSVGVMAESVFNEKASPFEANPSGKDEEISRTLF
jgi:hypothetical protein